MRQNLYAISLLVCPPIAYDHDVFALGSNRSGYTYGHDTSRRDGAHSITQKGSLLAWIWRSRREIAISERYVSISFPLSTSCNVGFVLDSVQVGRWVKSQFGARSYVTAVFMTHAVINNNSGVSTSYYRAPSVTEVLTSSRSYNNISVIRKLLIVRTTYQLR
jgi:hypothetical protein